MEFRVLGPLEASGHAGPLRLGPRKQRALLARLLLDAGRTVAVERLLDDLWGDRLPDSAPKMVQIYVSGLRKALPKGMLETRPPGYVLHVEPGACDLDRFERLALDGRAALEAGDAPLAATRLGEALALWRGPALAEFTAEPFAAGEAMRLEELRLECVEQRIDAELALGHHTSVIGDLEALTRRHPLRERLHGQLILALYRAARQAEALAAYQAFRARLDDELGIEPSPALRELERAVLLQEPGLAAARAAPAPSSPPAPRPAETLPGRERELACLQRALDAARGGQSRVVVITGEPGIGKRALLDAFLDRAGDTLVAHGEAHGRADAYAPLLDALGRLADDEAVAATLAARAPAWLAHMPWLAGRGAGEPHGVTGERMVRQLIDALEHVAAERPVVLAVEDLEQADGATRELLGALARRRSPTRLLVVLTYAPGPAAEPLARDLRELCLAGHADLVTLGRLDPAAVAARLAARFPAAEPPPGVARLLWERAGGHPLLDRLLVDHWLSAGLIGD
ncbi:MAG: family transcriptional regulator, regulator of embCAB operon, partial [Solirubrobacteraceae bacterium]|nr:family transcriptional regulator, regulator of embCAB operon [Solirubrobacteraceae bacterium]